MPGFNDLPRERQIAVLDRYYGLSTHKWRLYVCSDCDPEFADDSEYAEAYRILCQQGADTPAFCPRCGSHLSLCEQGGDVFATFGLQGASSPQAPSQ